MRFPATMTALWILPYICVRTYARLEYWPDGPAVFAAGLSFWTNVRRGRTAGEVMFFWDGKNKKMTKSAKRAFILMKSCYNCSLRAFVWRVEYE
jgi:hypothetical protein